MLSFTEAQQHLLAAVTAPEATDPAQIEWLPLEACLGRILALPQQSTVAAPPLDNSAMDGYAVRVADLTGGDTLLPVSQRIPAGQVGLPLQPGTAARIFTGAPIPAGADAVVMQEHCTTEGEQVRIAHAPRAGENIRRAGEDIAPGATVLTAGQALRPQEIALAATAGLPRLPVFRRLKVAVFFTGDELFQPGEPLPPGGIYNSNRYALITLLQGLGCTVSDLGTVPDSLAATRAAIRQAAGQHDLIITSGGVSVGEEDHVKPAVEAEGRLDMWKVAIKPGKPLAFGEIRNPDTADAPATRFIGLPGNPVSSFVTFLMLVRPLIRRLQGAAEVLPRSYCLPAAFNWKKADNRTEFLRARLNAEGSVEIFPNQGSGVVTSLVWGDGLVLRAPETPVSPGDRVTFIPFAHLLV